MLKRTGNNATLHVQGRDIGQQQLGFISEAAGDMCSWKLVGEVPEEQVSRERQDIIGLLTESASPLGPKDISDKLKKSRESVRKMLHQMVNQQDPVIKKVGQGNQTKYTIVGSGNSTEVIALGGNSSGNTYIHEEPSDSRGSSQAVTGVTAVTGGTELGGVLNLLRKDYPIPCKRIEELVACKQLSSGDAIMAANHLLDGEVLEAAEIMDQR